MFIKCPLAGERKYPVTSNLVYEHLSSSSTSGPNLVILALIYIYFLAPFVAAGCNYVNGEFLRLQSDLALKVHYILHHCKRRLVARPTVVLVFTVVAVPDCS